MTSKLLSIDSVHFSYGALQVLRHLDLEVERDEFVSLVGPLGCGKTTLLSLISGHHKPGRGEVRRRGSMRMVYQIDSLLPWLTAAENISLGLRALSDRKQRCQRVNEMLLLTNLAGFSDHFPHQLSGGMRRRVELARVLAGETDLLLMDEPFSGLDYLTRHGLKTELERLLALKPRTVLLVTHDIEDAVYLSDRVIVLSNRPATIKYEMRLQLERPRRPTDPLLLEAKERILSHLDLQEPGPLASIAVGQRAGSLV
jgi:ABC-type nitrate/sulfonate/bicarbonate transport system ATPase subunit